MNFLHGIWHLHKPMVLSPLGSLPCADPEGGGGGGEQGVRTP